MTQYALSYYVPDTDKRWIRITRSVEAPDDTAARAIAEDILKEVRHHYNAQLERGYIAHLLQDQ